MVYGVNGSFTDSPGKVLQADDKQCGYVVGTGVANWAKSRENLGEWDFGISSSLNTRSNADTVH
jgi:hypothetical protein